MSQLVPAAQIEDIVGVPRHQGPVVLPSGRDGVRRDILWTIGGPRCQRAEVPDWVAQIALPLFEDQSP